MKKTMLLILAMFGLMVAAAQADDKWFDMEKCALCNCMADHQEIMQDLKWEVHKINNGVMMVHVIPEEHQKTMEAVTEKMMAKVAKLESGEQMELCGFCMGYGELKMGGSNIEEMQTIGGHITLITSDDDEMVEKIHAFAEKAKSEHDKMMKEMASKEK